MSDQNSNLAKLSAANNTNLSTNIEKPLEDKNNPAMDQTVDFVNNLVLAMLGVSINDIIEEKRDEMIKKCLEMFNDFIVGYFQDQFQPIDVTRLKAAQAYPDSDMFNKFPDLPGKFEQAYQAFLKQVELSWQEEESEDEQAPSA
jgi:hypothetical protein